MSVSAQVLIVVAYVNRPLSSAINDYQRDSYTKKKVNGYTKYQPTNIQRNTPGPSKTFFLQDSLNLILNFEGFEGV